MKEKDYVKSKSHGGVVVVLGCPKPKLFYVGFRMEETDEVGKKCGVHQLARWCNSKAVVHQSQGGEYRFPTGPLLSWFQSGRNGFGSNVLRNLTSSSC